MAAGTDGQRWAVSLSVPRRGGWRAWGTASGAFENGLVAQESDVVTAPRIDSESRRGADYVRVTLSMTVTATDVAQALATAWWTFRRAAGDDSAGWDMARAQADVRPAPVAVRRS